MRPSDRGVQSMADSETHNLAAVGSSPIPAKPRSVWLEEYQACGCSNVTKTKAGVIGYCPKHYTDRRRLSRIIDVGFQLGYAGVG